MAAILEGRSFVLDGNPLVLPWMNIHGAAYALQYGSHLGGQIFSPAGKPLCAYPVEQKRLACKMAAMQIFSGTQFLVMLEIFICNLAKNKNQ